MKKRFFLVITLCTYSVFGQESPKNAVTLGVNLSNFNNEFYALITPGLNLGYERLLNGDFSIGLDIGSTGILVWPYAEIQGRWHPWSKTFFAGLGLGIWGFIPAPGGRAFNPMISPNIGWKINIGKAKRWVLTPSVTGRILLDKQPVEFLAEICLRAGYKF